MPLRFERRLGIALRQHIQETQIKNMQSNARINVPKLNT
jgi:hypothetical protein